MSMKEMESKIRELHQLQALIEEAQAEVEAIKDTIKAAMPKRSLLFSKRPKRGKVRQGFPVHGLQLVRQLVGFTVKILIPCDLHL